MGYFQSMLFNLRGHGGKFQKFILPPIIVFQKLFITHISVV